MAFVAAIAFTGNITDGIAVSETIGKRINGGALVVDVRTPVEFSSGNYSGAVNIPLSEIESRLWEFGSKNRPIVVYCRTGNRSFHAKALLEKHGFTDVSNGGGLKDMLGK